MSSSFLSSFNIIFNTKQSTLFGIEKLQLKRFGLNFLVLPFWYYNVLVVKNSIKIDLIFGLKFRINKVKRRVKRLKIENFV